MHRALGRLLVSWAPLGLLIAAFLVTRDPSLVPRPLALLAGEIAYLALGAALLLGLAFNRGRTFFSAVVMSLAFGACKHYLAGGIGDLTPRTVYAMLCILAPLTLMALAILEERGTTGGQALLRVALIAAACAVPAAILYTGDQALIRWAYVKLVEAPLPIKTPIPQLGILAIAASLIGTVVLGGRLGRPVPVSTLWTIAALAGGLHSVTTALGAAAYFAAAGLILSLAVLSVSYRMAFQDELTALPSRRALEEALRAVGGTYAIGVVDVDHFKRLNDTYGHDVGDQVLRMIGARLVDMAGGGRAFRYGGEEFAVLFSGKDAKGALPHLEELRAAIAGYRIAIRSDQRERRLDLRNGRSAKERSEPETINVTVSIGVAARSAEHPDTKSVFNAADAALYRAKREGRNRVCA
ncbi:MAG: GGDEF domain-containing protein [Burkholderiales bacterium]|nr:GGDEF domain-containing protein [Burkholderiales bacterium]